MVLMAVLTGDIVNSTKLSASREKQLNEQLIGQFAGYKSSLEFYRGDSFQAYLQDPAQALRLALLSRTAAIAIAKDSKKVQADVRISIGIGKVDTPVTSLKTAKGEAFILSGRAFDEMVQQEQRLAIVCANPLANEGLQVITDYLNSIFQVMTGKQAEVMYELLAGKSQTDVARQLKKTKSTIHQRTSSGGWAAIEKLLQQYENIIKYLA